MDYTKIQINNNSILYNGKSENVIPILDDNSIDLVITSPPYNVDLGNNKFNENSYDVYNDNKDHKEFIEWLRDIFFKLYPKIKSGGRVVVNIGDPKNGRIPTHADITHFMTNDLKYLPMATIIWDKKQVGNRLAWGSYNSPSCPSFPQSFEYIMIFSKDNIKLQYQGESDLIPKEFQEWAFSMWTMGCETEMKEIGHPAMFPVELPYRLIKMLSWKNSTILDPFNGAGTTGVACEILGRKYIGIELSENYCNITEKRIKDTRGKTEIDIFSNEIEY